MSGTSTAYVGPVVPDEERYRNEAFSRAGNQFQLNFLKALRYSSIPEPEVFSFIPMPSFPRGKTLVCWGGKTDVEGRRIRLLPFVNFGPLRMLSLGIAAFIHVLRWGMAHRTSDKRLLFVYNLTAPPVGFLQLACRLTRTKVVALLQDINVPGEVVPNTMLRRAEFNLQKRAIPKLHGLLVANKAMVDDFAPGKPYLLIAGGVQEDFIDRFPQKRDVGNPFKIVFAGHLNELNGLDLLLDAASLNLDPDVRFVIAGKGDLEHRVGKAAEADKRIQFEGFVSMERMIELYRDADLLLNLRRTDREASRYVFPSKLVECLATGRPVLTTPTGHTQEEFGLFVSILRQENGQGLADAIQAIRNSAQEERFERAREGQAYIRTNKTWPAYIHALEAYLQEHVL